MRRWRSPRPPQNRQSHLIRIPLLCSGWRFASSLPCSISCWFHARTCCDCRILIVSRRRSWIGSGNRSYCPWLGLCSRLTWSLSGPLSSRLRRIRLIFFLSIRRGSCRWGGSSVIGRRISRVTTIRWWYSVVYRSLIIWFPRRDRPQVHLGIPKEAVAHFEEALVLWGPVRLAERQAQIEDVD